MEMTSRQRVEAAISFQETDRVPIDLGGTLCSGIHASTYARLKEHLSISEGKCRVIDVSQMLAEVEIPVLSRLGCDVVPLNPLEADFGIRAADWKSWRMWDGTQVEVPGGFSPVEDTDGDLLLYPGNDNTQPPVAKMPKDGFYFDHLEPPFTSGDIPRVDLSEFRKRLGVFKHEELDELQTRARLLYQETDYAVAGNFLMGCPYGVGGGMDWLMTMLTDGQYVHDIHGVETEVTLQNLKRYLDAVGDYISVIVAGLYDFGMQRSEFLSPESFREFYVPYLKQINDCVHSCSKAKVFFHSCGSIRQIIGPMIDSGIDILNPVQCSAANMDAEELKQEFGEKVVFWGGGVDTQHTLPFGTADEVRHEVAERVRIFGDGGGFVFTTVHNVQHGVPCENLIAMYETASGVRIGG